MKYLCLIYIEEKTLGSLSPAEYDAIEDECTDYDKRLKSSGHLIAVEALQPVHTATTVRLRNGKISTMDGPFAETKEQLAGFYLVDARDLNEAIQIAAKIPPGCLGCVEVRPVRELQQG